jgi:LAGLIDADG-like domain
MTEYVAGFFDADGSVSLTRLGRLENRSPVIVFTNTQKAILDKIRIHLVKAIPEGPIGSLIRRPGRKLGHSMTYDLKYSHNNALVVARLLLAFSLHPEKTRKLKLLVGYYQSVTPRNGKYTPEMRAAKQEFETEFYREGMGK